MILNEDFFNDIEIKDEDLTTEDPYLNVKEYNVKTPRELIEYEKSESEMVLVIYINNFLHGQFNIWRRIERIMKRLKYMFNIYNINLSEPFITYEDISFKILRNKKIPDKKQNYILIQHKGCNLYFPEDKLRKYGTDGIIEKDILEVFVFLDKKISVFTKARSAYNFLIGLDKCLWKDITDPKDDCFQWYALYNINKNKICDGEVIGSYSSCNSYATDNAI